MKKVLFGILAIFMSLSLAYGSGSLIQNFVLHSQSQTGNEEEEEIKITASGNWKDYATSFSGDGTSKNPYKISTAGQLAKLSKDVNGGNSYSGKYFHLMNNIDLSAHYWTPIGWKKNDDKSYPFSGDFYGNGHEIKGIYIHAERGQLDKLFGGSNVESGRRIGLFGYTESADFYNLKISGQFNFYGHTVWTNEAKPTAFIGGLVGYAYNTNLYNIENTELSILNYRGNKEWCIFSQKQYVGGLVGYAEESDFSGCTNKKGIIRYDVSAGTKENNAGEYWLGGIVGYASDRSSIYNSLFQSQVEYVGPTANNDAARIKSLYMGGIAGTRIGDIRTIDNCYSNGQLTIKNQLNLQSSGAIGGIVGGSSCRITAVTNYSKITASEISKVHVGGISGIASSKSIERCANFGNLELTASRNAASDGYGGIVGYSVDSSISDCANYGNVIGKDKNVSNVGGILGAGIASFTDKSIERCVNYGKVKGYAQIGGIAGGVGGGGGNWGTLYLKNSINFCEEVVGPGGYANNFVGYTVGKVSVDKCYYNSINGRGGGHGNVSGTSNTELHSSIADSILAIEDEWTYSDTFDKWMRSTLPVQYFSDRSGKGMLEYALVPMGVLGQVEVIAKYNEDKEFATTTNEETGRVVYVSDFGKIEYWAYDKKTSTVKWIETKNFQYLRGINNSKSNRNLFRFKVSTDFDFGSVILQEKWTESKLPVDLEIAGEYYYIGFSEELTVFNDSGRLTLTVSSKPKGITLKYWKLTKSNDEQWSPTVGTGIVGEVIVKPKDENDTDGKYDYYQEMQLTANPDPGWAFVGLFSGGDGEDKDKKSFTENTRVDGTLNGSLKYVGLVPNIDKYGKCDKDFNFVIRGEEKEGSLIYNVLFAAIDYTVTINADWRGDKTTEQNMTFGKDITLPDDKLNLEYGYYYNFYIKAPNAQENETGTQLMGNGYENFEGGKIVLKSTDIINIVGEINNGKEDWEIKNEFNIVVTREEIAFEINILNMANSLNNVYELTTDSKFQTTFSENGKSIIKGVKVTDSSSRLKIIATPVTFYEFSGIGFDQTSSTSLAYKAEAWSGEAVPADIQGFINKLKDKIKTHSGNEITLYAYYTLKTYTLSLNVKVGEGFVEAGEYIAVESDENNVTNSSYHYTSTVTLTAKYVKGHRFVGWFNTDGNLLSLNHEYKYTHKEESGETGDITISAYFETSATTDKVLIDKRKIYTISSKEDLVWLSNKVEGGETFAGCIFNQTANIDMAGVLLNPIGNVDKPFKGTYNGNNYEILNLKLVGNRGDTSNYNSHLSYMGLFGVTDGATLKNLTFRGGSISGYSHVGALVGYAKNTIIENVQNHSLTIIPSAVTFYDIYKGEILLSGDGKDYCGNYYAPRQYFGGVVGLAEGTKMIGLSNKAAVGEESVESVGGVVGCLKGESILQQSFNEGDVYGKTTDLLANGLNGSNVKDCFARNSGGATTLYNATGKNGSVNGVYSSSTELDNSIWISVNGKLCLKYFYWN